MKAPSFDYRRPGSIDEAMALLADHAGAAQILAGGQSLMPALNMRLSAPALLVDINRIDVLRGIEERGREIRIGALVRHAEVMDSPLIARHVPLLAQAIPHVAHMAVRNRGTTCGSLAFADPSAEMPAVAVALDARIVLQNRSGSRVVGARAFFQGLYQTARREDEMIVEALFPKAAANEVFGFAELARRHGDFAVVGAVARAAVERGQLSGLSLVLFGSEPAPLLSPTAATLVILPRTAEEELASMAARIAADMSPMENHQGRAETKRHQAAVLIRRLLRQLQQRSFHAGSA